MSSIRVCFKHLIGDRAIEMGLNGVVHYLHGHGSSGIEEMKMTGVKRHILDEEERRSIGKKITEVIACQPEILFAFLHGSFLEGPAFRDIDLGLFISGVDATSFWDYETGLTQRIEKALDGHYVVEPRVINRAPLSFCYHVIRGRLLFARDEDMLTAYMVRVARGYLEMAPMRHRYILEAIR